jgi:NSS family neurotransmitter:Na+ symporter
MFGALQIAFKQMAYGNVIASLFYGVLVLAALTSAISFVEVIVTSSMTQFSLSRNTATLLCVTLVTLPIMLCISSFNYLHHILIFGENIFNFMVNSLTNKFLPFTALCVSISYGLNVNQNRLTNALFSNQTMARVAGRYISIVLSTTILVYFYFSIFSK